MEWWVIISNLTGPVLIVIGAVFNGSVIKPLNTTIHLLNAAVEALREEIKTETEKRHEIAERLAKVETATSSAHHRINELDARLQRHEHDK